MKRSNTNPLFLVGILVVLAPRAHSEKIWTNSVSGLWSDGGNWSGHTPPDSTSFIEITNDISKTVTIDASATAATMTVQKLTLSAPAGATNTLLLSDAGTNNPLILQTGLELMDGAVVRITNSALVTQLMNDHVNIDGSLTLDSGLIDFGDITVTSRVGRVTSGVLTLNSGTMSVGTMTVGGLTNSSGTVYQNGGTLTVGALLSVGRNLSTTGAFLLSGGQLNVPNDDTRVGDEGVGQMLVTNSTAYLTNLQVGRDGVGTMTIQSGGVVQVLTDVALGRFSGSTGTLAVAGGQLTAGVQKIYVARAGNGQLNVSGGTIQAASILVNADTTNSIGATGTMSVSGGSVLLATNLFVGSSGFSPGQALLSGGSVTVTNAASSGLLSIANGTLTLNGGNVTADSLVLNSGSGQLQFLSGTLTTKGTTVANGAAFVIGDGSHPAVFHLNGGTHSFGNGLVISSNATLDGCGTVIGNIVNQGTIATNCGGTITGMTITFAGRKGQTNTIAVPSVAGLHYTLQYKNALSDTNWTDILPSTAGSGIPLLLLDTTAAGTGRFYRVHAQ